MIIKHVIRHDFSDEERRRIGAGLVARFGRRLASEGMADERSLATRQEIKNLLDDFGKCSDLNQNWVDFWHEGDEQLQKWRDNGAGPEENE